MSDLTKALDDLITDLVEHRPATAVRIVIEQHGERISRAAIRDYKVNTHARDSIRDAARRAESIRLFGHPGGHIAEERINVVLAKAAGPEL